MALFVLMVLAAFHWIVNVSKCTQTNELIEHWKMFGLVAFSNGQNWSSSLANWYTNPSQAKIVWVLTRKYAFGNYKYAMVHPFLSYSYGNRRFHNDTFGKSNKNYSVHFICFIYFRSSKWNIVGGTECSLHSEKLLFLMYNCWADTLEGWFSNNFRVKVQNIWQNTKLKSTQTIQTSNGNLTINWIKLLEFAFSLYIYRFTFGKYWL